MAWTENINAKYVDFDALSKVKFLHGTQAELNAYLEEGAAKYGQAIEGAFYLTTDTQRLYVGRKISASVIVPAPVNEGLTRVATESDLPITANVGDFYYITEGNILAVCSRVYTEADKRRCSWVQLNRDTYLKSVKYDVDTDVNNNAVITTEVRDSGNHALSDSFKLGKGDNIAFAVTGQGTSSDPYVLTITATDTKYDLGVTAGANSAAITLTNQDDSSDVDTVTIQGYTDSNSRVVDKVTVSGTTTTIESAVPTSLEMTADSSNDGWNVVLKRGLLSEARSNDATVADFDFDPVITYGATGSGIAAAHTNESVHFRNGSAVLNVYTKDQSDDRIVDEVTKALRNFNAMQFKGVITSASQLPASGTNYQIGDVYRIVATQKVESDNIATDYNGTSLNYVKTSNGHPYVENGDLVVAVGTEDATTGNITAATLKFIPIPSGDEKTYTVDVTGNTTASYDDTTGTSHFEINEGSASFLEYTLTGDSSQKKILVSSVANGKSITTTLQHAKVSVTPTTATAITQNHVFTSSNAAATELTFNVEYYTFDDTGHLSGKTIQPYTIQDTHNHIDSIEATYAVANRTGTVNPVNTEATDCTATVSIEVTNDDGDSAIGDVLYKSDTLKFYTDSSSAAPGVTMEIVWGTF